jgi:putative transposase
MPRTPRQFVPGGFYHVFSRGSNRQAIFAFDSDRIDFIDCLARTVKTHDVACLAYCLMPNHYHLVVQTRDGGLSNAMKALNGRYSLRFNQRHGRDAHLFKNRFGAVLQATDEQIVWTLRYTARNPVESGLCAQPEEWPWSSYRATVGLDKCPSFLHVRALLRFFGDRTDAAVERYRDLATMP